MLEAILGDQINLTVNLTVKAVVAETYSLRDNGLQVPLTIEWSCGLVHTVG
jgi:hypothetical protein